MHKLQEKVTGYIKKELESLVKYQISRVAEQVAEKVKKELFPPKQEKPK